jgi:hypothetical protein
MFQTKVVEKIEKHILRSTTPPHPPPESRAVYEKTRKNIVEPGKPQVTIWLLLVCWIPQATNTHSQYVIIITFALQKWLHERASILRDTFSASLVYLRDQPKMQDA